MSKGVTLADEVGLVKRIRAGILLCRYWAGRRPRDIARERKVHDVNDKNCNMERAQAG